MFAMCCFTSESHTLPGIKQPNIVAPTIPNWNKITTLIRLITLSLLFWFNDVTIVAVRIWAKIGYWA